ncbi:MAG: ABC transporter permease [Patescibacteria group bacterium]
MKKFYILVKKEIKELLTIQMIAPLIMVVIVFVFIGKTVGKQVAQTAQSNTPIAVLDLDNSKSSKNLEDALKNNHFDITVYQNLSADEAVARARSDNEKSLVVIPAGFEQNLNNQKTTPLPIYTIMTNFSFTGSRGSQNLAIALAAINENLNKKPAEKLLQEDDYVVIGDRQAHVSPAAISGYISSQTTFIPIVLFLVIVFASQLIVTSIATEKENKTLETLLSSPVSRRSLVAAKLVGAGLVALLTSAIYLVGMRSYINGITGSTGGGTNAAIQAAAVQLGLVFNSTDYILLGLSLFFGILVALSIALILGSFAQDTKSAQGIISPLMLLIMLPYFMIMFLDLNTISPALKYLIYIIPFSHPFLAAPNLMLGQYYNIWLGIGYMAILFLIFVIIAARIFASDKILTLNLNFKRTKRGNQI